MAAGKQQIDMMLKQMAAGESEVVLPEATTLHEMLAGAKLSANADGIASMYEAFEFTAGYRIGLGSFAKALEGVVEEVASVDGGEATAAQSGEGADTSAEVNAQIAARRLMNSFPEVLPAELHDVEEQRGAEHLLTFAQTTEAVKIQSYMDEAYSRYRESMPQAAVNDPEPILRAKWARLHFVA